MKENRIPRLLTVLIVGGCCLLLAIGMMLTPSMVAAFRGGKTVVIPEEETGGHIDAPVTETETQEEMIFPITAPAVYAPENMFWITKDGDPADIMAAAIPEGKKASRPDARLVEKAEVATELVERINDIIMHYYAFSTLRPPQDLQQLENTAHYTLRFGNGEDEYVTFYKSGYMAMAGMEQAIDFKHNDGFTLLAEAYQGAAVEYYYKESVKKVLTGLPSPSAEKLRNGGRVYYVKNTAYCYPLTATEAFEFRTASSRYPASLSSDDVTYLVELIDRISAERWILAVPGALLGTETADGLSTACLFDFQAEAPDATDRHREREALLSWLTRLSDRVTICSVTTDGKDPEAVDPIAEDFWYFPNMESEKDVRYLLWRYRGKGDPVGIEVPNLPIFHISAAEGVQFYESLKENAPVYVGLQDFWIPQRPTLPTVSGHASPSDVIFIGTPSATVEQLLSAAIPNASEGERLHNFLRIARTPADINLISKTLQKALNSLGKAKNAIPLSRVSGERFTVRFGEAASDVVIVYKEGYLAMGDWHYAMKINGSNPYPTIWEPIRTGDWKLASQDDVSYRVGLREILGAKQEPSSYELLTGGRVYDFGNGDAYYTVLSEEELSGIEGPYGTDSPAVEDVLYLLEVLELAAKKGVSIYIPAYGDKEATVFLASDLQDGQTGANAKREVLTAWLMSMSPNSLYTVLTPPGGTVSTPAFGAFSPYDYWLIPSRREGFDVNRLLTHFTETENREGLDFPAFHIHDGGVDYYESLAENDPVRLLGNT